MTSKDNLAIACKVNAIGKGHYGIVGASTIPDSGLGLFAARNYNAGETVCIYGGKYGHRLAGEFVLRLNSHFDVDAADGDSFDSIDCGRFVQHSDSDSVINTDYRIRNIGGHPVAFVVTTKEVAAGSEFFVSYGPGYAFANGMRSPIKTIATRKECSRKHKKFCPEF